MIDYSEMPNDYISEDCLHIHRFGHNNENIEVLSISLDYLVEAFEHNDDWETVK